MPLQFMELLFGCLILVRDYEKCIFTTLELRHELDFESNASAIIYISRNDSRWFVEQQHYVIRLTHPRWDFSDHRPLAAPDKRSFEKDEISSRKRRHFEEPLAIWTLTRHSQSPGSLHQVFYYLITDRFLDSDTHFISRIDLQKTNAENLKKSVDISTFGWVKSSRALKLLFWRCIINERQWLHGNHLTR